jgi:hypothetical protein
MRSASKSSSSQSDSALATEPLRSLARSRAQDAALAGHRPRRRRLRYTMAYVRMLAALTSSGSQVGSQRAATPGHARPHAATEGAGERHTGPHPATAGVCMACKRSGVRIPTAPRFRSSEAVCADLDRLLFVQQVTLSGELAWPGVLAGQRFVTSLIGHICCGWGRSGAKWGASRLVHVPPKAPDGRPGWPAQRHRRHAEWVPRRAPDSATSARSPNIRFSPGQLAQRQASADPPVRGDSS